MTTTKVLPKISIIIAVYNVQNYLKQCLDSLVNQTLEDIEIICVNDGSTDNSLAILEEYAKKDERIKVISQKNSGGPGSPRNKALDLAKGEYICITDSDDYRAPDNLEKLYNAAVQYNTDSAFGDVKVVSKNGIHIEDFIDSRPYNVVLDASTSFENSIYQCQSIFKRELIKNIRYLENTDLEDYAYGYEVLMNINTTVHVKDSIYYYRQLLNSLCHGKTTRILRIPIVLDELKKLAEKYQNCSKVVFLKRNYKKCVERFLRSCFFARLPDDVPYEYIYISFCDFCPHMNWQQKIFYFSKIIFHEIQKIVLPKLFRIEKREYYERITFLNKYRVILLRKRAKRIKKTLKVKHNA